MHGKIIHYNIVVPIFYFNLQVEIHLKSPNQIKEWSKYQVQQFINYIGEKGESYFIFCRINYFKIQHTKSKKTQAESYIETPQLLSNTKGIINIKTIMMIG